MTQICHFGHAKLVFFWIHGHTDVLHLLQRSVQSAIVFLNRRSPYQYVIDVGFHSFQIFEVLTDSLVEHLALSVFQKAFVGTCSDQMAC